MCELIAENQHARVMKISSDPEKYEVVEEDGSKPFDSLSEAESWFNLIKEKHVKKE